ncbi:CBS domain-containing protein|uniref:CBS domain-containing protein n=1 Tax=Rhizobium altiplani TaxID=1864509 RepID=UPI001FD8DDD9|nr:CBS domain-containing protein [Rhizobium altiplani]
MTSPVVSALPAATIVQVADLLLARAIKHNPVVADERLVGMISRRDLMRAMVDEPSGSVACGDDAICQAVRARLQADLGVLPEAIDTSVRADWLHFAEKLTTLSSGKQQEGLTVFPVYMVCQTSSRSPIT